MSKIEEMNKVYHEYSNKYKEQELVMGTGNHDTKIILIGEAPGKDEVTTGKPFVGAAGKHLQKFLQVIELEREEIYITNIIKYRLFKVNERTGRKSNRPAKKNEVDDNRIWLNKEIHIIKPDIIVTLGNVPLKGVLGNTSPAIGFVHGRLFECKLDGMDYRVFPLYHPASIIYNQSLIKVYERDLEELKGCLRSINAN